MLRLGYDQATVQDTIQWQTVGSSTDTQKIYEGNKENIRTSFGTPENRYKIHLQRFPTAAKEAQSTQDLNPAYKLFEETLLGPWQRARLRRLGRFCTGRNNMLDCMKGRENGSITKY